MSSKDRLTKPGEPRHRGAVWLPAGANAFNVLLFKRFFDSLSRDVFEAARMDGATFLVFQRVFHRGGGMEGAVKG